MSSFLPSTRHFPKARVYLRRVEAEPEDGYQLFTLTRITYPSITSWVDEIAGLAIRALSQPVPMRSGGARVTLDEVIHGVPRSIGEPIVTDPHALLRALQATPSYASPVLRPTSLTCLRLCWSTISAPQATRLQHVSDDSADSSDATVNPALADAGSHYLHVIDIARSTGEVIPVSIGRSHSASEICCGNPTSVRDKTLPKALQSLLADVRMLRHVDHLPDITTQYLPAYSAAVVHALLSRAMRAFNYPHARSA